MVTGSSENRVDVDWWKRYDHRVRRVIPIRGGTSRMAVL